MLEMHCDGISNLELGNSNEKGSPISTRIPNLGMEKDVGEGTGHETINGKGNLNGMRTQPCMHIVGIGSIEQETPNSGNVQTDEQPQVGNSGVVVIVLINDDGGMDGKSWPEILVQLLCMKIKATWGLKETIWTPGTRSTEVLL
ncbi:hypothetical protein FRX31_032964, partial [Thalictrum thalictroides]